MLDTCGHASTGTDFSRFARVSGRDWRPDLLGWCATAGDRGIQGTLDGIIYFGPGCPSPKSRVVESIHPFFVGLACHLYTQIPGLGRAGLGWLAGWPGSHSGPPGTACFSKPLLDESPKCADDLKDAVACDAAQCLRLGNHVSRELQLSWVPLVRKKKEKTFEERQKIF